MRQSPVPTLQQNTHFLNFSHFSLNITTTIPVKGGGRWVFLLGPVAAVYPQPTQHFCSSFTELRIVLWRVWIRCCLGGWLSNTSHYTSLSPPITNQQLN